MISSYDCRAQNLLLVFTSDVRSGGTHKAGDSHSGIQSHPWSRFRRGPVVGHLGKAMLHRSLTLDKPNRHSRDETTGSLPSAHAVDLRWLTITSLGQIPADFCHAAAAIRGG